MNTKSRRPLTPEDMSRIQLIEVRERLLRAQKKQVELAGQAVNFLAVLDVADRKRAASGRGRLSQQRLATLKRLRQAEVGKAYDPLLRLNKAALDRMDRTAAIMRTPGAPFRGLRVED
jgi:hypothetical protein